MSKPEDIPQDVWDAVIHLDLYPVADGDRAYLPSDDLATIARAIMAERDRCSRIVFCAYERKTGICSRIHRKIRSGVAQ